jgi:hypothetical protein
MKRFKSIAAFLLLGMVAIFLTTQSHAIEIPALGGDELLDFDGLGGATLATLGAGLPVRSMRSIESEADAYLSSYEGMGGQEDLSLIGYDGFGDDLLDFDGIGTTFKNEIETNRRFTITIDNSANAVDRTVILFESYDPSSANVITDGAFNSVEGTAMSASTPFGKIKALRAFVFNNPTRCLGFKVESDQISQISKSLTITPKIPFQNLTDKTVFFSDYTNEHVYQDKKVSIPYKFQVDNQHEVKIVIAASAKTTLTFFFGAVLNTGKALKVKADAAAIATNARQVRM